MGHILSQPTAEGSLGPRHMITWALLSRRMVGVGSRERLNIGAEIPQH